MGRKRTEWRRGDTMKDEYYAKIIELWWVVSGAISRIVLFFYDSDFCWRIYFHFLTKFLLTCVSPATPSCAIFIIVFSSIREGSGGWHQIGPGIVKMMAEVKAIDEKKGSTFH
jgi:hypothetical protein